MQRKKKKEKRKEKRKEKGGNQGGKSKPGPTTGKVYEILAKSIPENKMAC